MPNRVNVDQLIRELRDAARRVGFSESVYGTAGGHPLLGLLRPAAETATPPRRIYLSAGIHGDEPAGPLALLELLRENALPRHHHFFLCPLMNPTGLSVGTRENAAGLDLNRGYTDFAAVEIETHREWLAAHVDYLDLGILLHEDWEASGFYLYELNFGKAESRADHILQAAKRFLPVETAELIDGRPARAGVIRPESVPEIPEGLPEAIFLQQALGGVNYTIETPSGMPLEQRVGALKAAALAALD